MGIISTCFMVARGNMSNTPIDKISIGDTVITEDSVACRIVDASYRKDRLEHLIAVEIETGLHRWLSGESYYVVKELE